MCNKENKQSVKKRPCRKICSEEELVAATQFNKKVFQTLRVGVAVYQADGQCVFVNLCMREIVGGSKEDILQQNFKHIYSWKTCDLLEHAETVLADGNEIQHEVQIVSTFGKELWIEYSLSRFLLDDDFYLLLMAKDITARKTAEKAVVDSEENFRTLYENIAGGILIVDDNYIIRDVNERTCEITGYSKDELVGQQCDIICPKGAASKECPIWEKKQPGFIGMDTAVKRRDGFKNPIIKNARRLKVHGQPLIFENFQDIAKRKQAEEDLITAKEEAEKANILKTQFIANISHELRTPLNSIISLNDLMLDTSLEKEQLEFTRLIKESADDLRGIIDTILDFSKISENRTVNSGKQFEFKDMVSFVSDKMVPKACDKGLALAFDIAQDVPDLLIGEAKRLQQVLIYLIDNAIKFTSVGSVHVRAAISEKMSDALVLRFTVADTGIGIPQDKFDKIFDLFFQADGSFTRKYGGTGLGLAIVKEFVKAMDGDIGLESVVSKGTTFWFTATCHIPAPAK